MKLDAKIIKSLKLTYFDLEGRGECIRLALTLTGTPFEDDRVPFSHWNILKPTTPHGQLPVMTIGRIKDNNNNSSDIPIVRTQSQALLRWVGATFTTEKYNLYPNHEILNIEVALGLINDFSMSRKPCMELGAYPEKYGYPKDYHQTDEGKAKVKFMREQWATVELPRYLGYFSDMILSNKNEKESGGEKCSTNWLVTTASQGPTIADCLLVPALRSFTTGQIDYMDTNCLESCPTIVDYVKRFCALDEIKGRYHVGLH